MEPRAELAASWLARAADDLRLAELALSADPPVVWASAFHAQQAAEKALKALLTIHQIEYRKSHSIDYLAEICLEAEPGLEQLREAATRLTDFAVGPRYPLPEGDPTRDEAEEALAIARRVYDFVQRRIQGLPGEK